MRTDQCPASTNLIYNHGVRQVVSFDFISIIRNFLGTLRNFSKDPRTLHSIGSTAFPVQQCSLVQWLHNLLGIRHPATSGSASSAQQLPSNQVAKPHLAVSTSAARRQSIITQALHHCKTITTTNLLTAVKPVNWIGAVNLVNIDIGKS